MASSIQTIVLDPFIVDIEECRIERPDRSKVDDLVGRFARVGSGLGENGRRAPGT